MQKKILFFMQSLGGGGAERTVVNIVNNLNKELFSVKLVIGNNNSNAYSEFLDQKINVIDLKTTRLRYSIVKLRKIINKEQPDIIFTTVNHNNIITSLVTASLVNNKPKLIVREAAIRSESKKAKLINKILTKFCYNIIADGVVALSKGVKNDLVMNFGINKGKVKVIYNPVDIEKIEAMKSESIDEEFVDDEKVLISVGRLVDTKDYPTLLRAFKIISERFKAKLIIAGIGELEKELKQMALDLGIHNNVIFKGFLKNPYKYMSKSDIFILTSKWEGFGHVIVEAMAAGLPVISTECNSGPKEIITNNINGKLVEVGNFEDLADTIIETLENDNSKLVYNARSRAQDFNVKKIINDYEGYLLKILKI
jgi:glycosyltransferase involved in cell wall biosynthesis